METACYTNDWLWLILNQPPSSFEGVLLSPGGLTASCLSRSFPRLFRDLKMAVRILMLINFILGPTEMRKCPDTGWKTGLNTPFAG